MGLNVEVQLEARVVGVWGGVSLGKSQRRWGQGVEWGSEQGACKLELGFYSKYNGKSSEHFRVFSTFNKNMSVSGLCGCWFSQGPLRWFCSFSQSNHWLPPLDVLQP